MSEDIDVKSIVRIAGGATSVGKALGIRASAVSNWRHIPAAHVHKVSALSGISVEQIRPDLMPKAREAAE
jgi:DNA-binding transcriptional regulator YdaS (Cro superfamily)